MRSDTRHSQAIQPSMFHLERLKKSVSEGHRDRSRRVIETSLRGSSRPVSEGHRDQSQRVIETRESAESLIVSPRGGSVNVSGAARPRWQEKWLPRRGITTAGTELLRLIDPKQTNQKETQHSYSHKIRILESLPGLAIRLIFVGYGQYKVLCEWDSNVPSDCYFYL